ncbi:phosphodiester glycosidase family protein [Anaerocolumna jejuensis]|uniref:phosphodiester glycosidase family protein n=1 Tax=Anaerocolumna jejuensis TaxID=259063 RepID=UPI003F7BBF89
MNKKRKVTLKYLAPFMVILLLICQMTYVYAATTISNGYTKKTILDKTCYIYQTDSSKESVDLSVYPTGSKQTLNNMILSNKNLTLTAKTNSNFMEYGQDAVAFYGFAYANGKLYYNGKLIPNNDPTKITLDSRLVSLVYKNNGSVLIDRLKYNGTDTVKSAITNAKFIVSGSRALLINGVDKFSTYGNDDGWPNESHDRTMLGIKNDNKTFLLVVAKSITGKEGVKIMKELGAYNAILLDGGGASQMYINGTGTVVGSSGTYYGTALIAYKN